MRGLSLVRMMEPDELAKRIDHTCLKPSAKANDLKRTCEEAIRYGFRGCCISPWYVKEASSILSSSKVKLVTVAGFPLGNQPLNAKLHEVELAFVNGADEVDVVMNISAFKSGMYEYVREELASLNDKASEYGGSLKVIIETSFLTTAEIRLASEMVAENGIAYVKSNTGFGSRGVTPSDVVIMYEVVKNSKTRVKAAGGIRRALDALILINLGADVIGTSSGPAIIEELKLMSKKA